MNTPSQVQRYPARGIAGDPPVPDCVLSGGWPDRRLRGIRPEASCPSCQHPADVRLPENSVLERAVKLPVNLEFK